MADQDPNLQQKESNMNNGDPTATILELIGDLLAESTTDPSAAGKLLESILERVAAISDPLQQAAISGNVLNLSNLERRDRTSRIWAFGSAYVHNLMQLLIPGKEFDGQGGFALTTSSNRSAGLFSPALILPVSASESQQEPKSHFQSTQHHLTGAVPTLEQAIIDRHHGMDTTIRPTNRALVELSPVASRYRSEKLEGTLSDNIFSQISLALLTKEIWNVNKSDPGGHSLEVPYLAEGRITIEDMFQHLSPEGRQSMQIIAPLLRRWLRSLEVTATAPIALAEGDPFGGDIMRDSSVIELLKNLEKAQKLASVPLTRETIRSNRRHPLRRYLHFIKSWNAEYWRTLINYPELLKEAPRQLAELANTRTIMVMAPTGAGKSTLSEQMLQDRQRLLGENDPNATTRLLFLGSDAIIGVSDGGLNLEGIKADSPINLLFSTIARAQEPLKRDSSKNLILMEMPPTMQIGTGPNAFHPRSKSIIEIAPRIASPAHIAHRLINNETPLQAIKDHDPSVATVSTIALSRLKKGNVEGIVMPMRRTSQSLELMSELANLQRGNFATDQSRWSREQTLERLYDIFNCLTPDLKALWWMGTIGDTQIIPISREFQGELTENDTYNNNIGALYYLLSLHNLRIINLLPDKNLFGRNVGQFLEDGTLSYRKLAQRIPLQHPAAVLIEAANHIRDGLHGSATSDSSQFLYGLAISLYSLFPDPGNI